MTNQSYNRVTITIEWPPDKWMGHGGWMRDVELLETLLVRLNLNAGRSTTTVTREWIDADDDD